MLRCLRWAMLVAVVALTACGGGSGSSSSGNGSSSSSSSSSSGSHNFSAGGPNVVPLTVGPGPTPSSSDFNIPTTSVTVCIGGTSTCTTIPNILVDTGAPGLRLLASALNGLALTEQPDPNVSGNIIAECLAFADGYTWGAVATADVTVGGEKASAVPINIIDDNSSFSPTVPASCTSNGTSLNSVNDIGANGFIGVSYQIQDCGADCAQILDNGFYYSCTASSCTPTTEALASQVTNPVTFFAADNNGVILQLTAITAAGATTATGYLVFGIGTQSNNGLESATVLTTSDTTHGTFTTLFNSQSLSGFLDSGSNSLTFADASIPDCTGSMTLAQFYCPTSTLTLSATNVGLNANISNVSFQIANFLSLSDFHFARDDVGATTTGINTGLPGGFFDFGLPFFYGRTVFVAIDGMPAGGTTGPYFAY